MDELSEEDKQTRCTARARSGTSSRNLSTSRRCSPARRKDRPAQDTIRGFKGILSGEFDSLPEQAFYMVGTIEEAVAKAKTLQ